MLICTFAGHRKIYAPELKMKLRGTLEGLLTVDDSFVFYNGGRVEKQWSAVSSEGRNC